MTTPPPNYLRVHRGDDSSSVATATNGQASKRPAVQEDHVAGFWRAYTEATGWRIDPRSEQHAISPSSPTESRSSEDMTKALGQAAMEDVDVLPAILDGISTCDSLPETPAVSAGDARRLAQAANQLAAQFHQQQAILQSQQAELAARAAVISNDQQRVLCNSSVDRILGDATLATQTTSAIVYLLDDETESLATRFVFGMSPGGRLGTSRALRGARADLEAMVQGVVVMEDLIHSPIDLWKAPESYDAAICVRLGGTDLPIGTMWLFASQPTNFSDTHTAAARLAATNIQQLLSLQDSTNYPTTSLSLAPWTGQPTDTPVVNDTPSPTDEDEQLDATNESVTLSPSEEITAQQTETPILRSDSAASDKIVPAKKNRRTILRRKAERYEVIMNQVAQWQHETLPLGSRLAPGWLVDGTVESPLEIAQSWHHWDVLPDGVLTFAICQRSSGFRHRTHLGETLDATLARAALQAHASYRHSPSEAITRVMNSIHQVRDETVSEHGAPTQSLLYAHIDPDTGEASIASVGSWDSLIVSKYGYRPLGAGSATETTNPAAANLTPQCNHTTLQPGEVLIVSSDNWDGWNDGLETQDNSPQHRIGSSLMNAIREGESYPLASLRRQFADSQMTAERTAITLQRFE